MSQSGEKSGAERLAKVIARSGMCSRRDAETWIKDSRVTVNGRLVVTPAFDVSPGDNIAVDGAPLAARQGTRVWLYHKPAGLVVTEKDPEGRETIFSALEKHGLPRVVTIGRLDINTEGLLLLTNDGGLKRVLELPATGWLRRYRVRAFGSVTQAQLDSLKNGIDVDGVAYGPIEASFERQQGSNSWIDVSLREGKNREIKNVLGALGLQVNRLIRVSFGPFQLGDLPVGSVSTVKARVLRDQLGKRLAELANVDFESDMPEVAAAAAPAANTARTSRSVLADPGRRVTPPGGKPVARKPRREAKSEETPRFRFTDRTDKAPRPSGVRTPRATTVEAAPAKPRGPVKRVHFDDGHTEFVEFKPAGRPRDGEGKPGGFGGPRGPRPDGDRPAKPYGDRPQRPFGDRPPRGEGKPGGFGGPRGPRPDGDRPAKPYGDRPQRPFGDRPPRGDGKPGGFGGPRGPRPDGDRPARPYGDRPQRPFGDRPPRGDGKPGGFGGPRGPRPDGDRPAKPYGDRPQRPFGDRPPRGDGKPGGFGGPRGPRPDGDRPAKPYGDRPQRPFEDRPPRGDGKPGGFGGPRGPRPDGDRPAKPYGDRPQRPFGDRPPRGDGKPGGFGKPRGPRPEGDRPSKPFGDRPPRSGGKPGGFGKPGGGRPAGGRPAGGRPGAGPKGPRKPRGE